MAAIPKKPQYSSYKSYITARTKRNSYLQNLYDFLENDNKNQRTCQIVCLEFFASSAAPRRQNLNLNSLATLLHNQTREDDNLRGRILIFEDLSNDIIEILGSTLNIDPFFFASHIDIPQTNITITRPFRALLPSMAKSQDFLTLHYHRLVDFENLTSNQTLLRDMNVPRKVKMLPETQGVKIGLVRHCCSVLKTVGKDRLWLGIVLVDAPVSDSYRSRRRDCTNAYKLQSRLFQGGFEDFLPGPSFLDETDSAPNPGPASLLENLIFYWNSERPQGFDTNCPTLISLSHYPLRIVAAEWMIYLELMYHSMKQYEYAPDTIPAALEQIAALNADLNALQRWGRRVMATSHKLRYAIDFLRCHSPKNLDSKPHSESSLIEDYEHIFSTLERYNHRLESTVPIVASLIQTIDSRRSLMEATNITRLTYLALIFVPLTFVSSLFSMTTKFAPGGNSFWVYFTVAIPVCMIVFLIARPPIRTFRLLAEKVWRLRIEQKFWV